MDYKLMPSLEHIAFVKVAVTLWNNYDTGDVASCSWNENHKFWQTVTGKVQKFDLPKLINRKLLNFVEAIHFEIVRWQSCYSTIYTEIKFISSMDVSKICWTPYGTVDKIKTAELLVQDEDIPVYSRYKLACIFCMENDVHTLWKRLYGSRFRPICGKYDSCLLYFWTHSMIRESGRLVDSGMTYLSSDIDCGYAFQYAAETGNDIAARYFLQRLTTDQKQKMLVQQAKYVAKTRTDGFYGTLVNGFYHMYHSNVLIDLLSAMNKEQQMEVFKENPYHTLTLFLEWPWQDFFLPLAQLMLNFISMEDYYCLLTDITRKASFTNEGCVFREIFTEFWQLSPPPYKKYVINKCVDCILLFGNLFKRKDKENISLILRDANVTEKEQLIFSPEGMHLCLNLAWRKECDLLEFFSHECISSLGTMILFKEKLRALATQHSSEGGWKMLISGL